MHVGEDGNGVYGNVWDNRERLIVVFGSGTVSMDHIIVVCVNLASDLLHGLL